MKKSKFIVKTEWWEIIKNLSDAEKVTLLNNLFLYHLGTSKLVSTPTEKVSVVWKLIKNSFVENKTKKTECVLENKINLAPFPSEFKQVWDDWILYKKSQFKFTYKSEKFEQMAFNELLRISGRNYIVATTIVKQSISNGWKGFFPIKSVNDSHYTPF